MNQHCGELVSVSEAYLAGVILRENGTQNLNEELMVRTGELHTKLILCKTKKLQ